MPNDNAATLRAQVTDHLWAIRSDAYTQLLAAAAAGERDLAGPEVEAARSQAVRGGNGGAIAVIPIQGVIRPKPTLFEMLFGVGGASVSRITRQLRDAAGDSSVGAIVLDVDSPGGFVDGVPELAEEIRGARTTKPIVAVANTHAASAAYWLASQATELFVSRSGQVGSVGVFVAHEDWSKFDERIGVKTTLISAGKYKTEGNPFEPLSDEARDAIQAVVDEYYAMFVDAVAKGRKVSPGTVRGGFGEGRMVLAEAATSEGMADEIGTLEDAISRAADLASGRGRRSAKSESTTAEDTGGLDERVAAEVARQLAGLTATPTDAGSTDGDPTVHDEDPWAELTASSPSFRAAQARQTP